MLLKQIFKKFLAKKLGVPEIAFALERLLKIGFYPKQIFDVGAYKGDFALECLRVWPNSKIACFEPQESCVKHLNQLRSLYSSIRVFPGLVGSESREMVVFHEAATASSILEEHILQKFPVKYYSMKTLNEIISNEFQGCSPEFLKLDVQGYELEILKGMEKNLANIHVILMEINLIDIHKDVPLLSDVVMWLKERGWLAYDICSLIRRPLDHALWQADFIFVPVASPFRIDKRWKA